MITFIDDLNMPKKDEYGSQPPIELIRHWIDYGFWYDRNKQQPKIIKEMQLVCAMGPPGGGRTEISARLQSRFNLINVTFPSESQVKRIYGTLINQKLVDFEEDIKSLGNRKITIFLIYF
jgi:dynein heavy chain